MRSSSHRAVAMSCLVSMSAIATTGCSSSYMPRPSPRVALAVVEGDVAVVRDGQATSLGIFGGGLEEAVADHPEAREHAETFSDFTIAGFVLGILGAGTTGGGVGLWVGNESGERNDGLRAAGIGLTIGGIVLSMTGAIFQVAAQPHLYDAINIYNDSVPAGYGPAPAAPGYAPPPPVYPGQPAPLAPAPSLPGPPVQAPPPTTTDPPSVAPPPTAEPPTPGEEPSAPESPPTPDPAPPGPTSPAPSPDPG